MSYEQIIKFIVKQIVEQKYYLDFFEKEIIKNAIDKTRNVQQLLYVLLIV